MWSNVIEQEHVKDILKNIHHSSKISHAFIFYGKEGIGKDATALEFAKLVNCENALPDGRQVNDKQEACNVCKSCKQISSFVSPNVKFITALPTGKSDSDKSVNPLESLDKEDFETYKKEIEKKAKDHYYNINIPNANNIRINSIRQIRNDVYLTGETGKKKVFIISRCEQMNPQSSNALLKILEEPPKDTILILTTSKLNSLLPTIIGRCQKIKFDSISTEGIKKYLLQSRSNLTEEQGDFFSKLADGSISKAKEILDSYFLELRENVVELLRAVVSNKTLKLNREIESITKSRDKEKVKQALLFMILWFRDVTYKLNGNDKEIINSDKIENITKFCNRFESNNYKIITLIEEAIRDIDMNINLNLLLYNLIYKIKTNIEIKS